MPKSTEKGSKPTSIEILNADSLDRFIANAKQAWLDLHPQDRKRRGRPSEMEAIFEVIWAAELKGHLGKTPTQGKLFRLVHEQMGEEAPSEKAIRKYAKMWLLLFRKPLAQWSRAERKWLAKQVPAVSKIKRLFLDLLYKHAKRTDLSSPGREKVKFVFSGPYAEMLPRVVDSLSREMDRFKPPKGANRYADPEDLFEELFNEYPPDALFRRRSA